MATMRARRRSNRFFPAVGDLPSLRPEQHRRSEMFSEGCWNSIRVSLEMRGWSPPHIELIHDQLRQGWPLSLAVRQVSIRLGTCPMRSKSLG